MHIVFLAWRDSAHPHAGGSEVVVAELAQRLTRRGHDVELLHGGPSTSDGYRSRSAGGTYSQYLAVPVEYHRQAGRPDVVVDVSNGVPFWSPLWQRAPVVTLVHHVHTEQWAMQFAPPVAWLGRWLEASVAPRVYRRATYLSVSSSTSASLVELGVDPARIKTIEMGVGFVPAPAGPAPQPRFVILGRLVPHKQVDVALRCWDAVRSQLGGGEFVVVGDGPEFSRLRSMAGPGVRFTGRVNEDQKRREIAAAWALVHTSHHEGWGVVITEAAIAGVPAVGFDVPGVSDAIIDEETGLLAQNEDDLVANWIRLATDDSLRCRLADDARARAAAFSWEHTVDRAEALLVDAVERSR
jgi:glycosyltransferase involved in cell wall biosynthesis